MNTARENISVVAGETFRLLRWTRSVGRVEVIRAPGQAESVAGHGDRWHYHPQTELTLIQRGSGTRFVGDQIELFDAGDLVLIGANVPHYWHLRGASAGLSLQWEFPLEHGIWSFAEAAAPLRRLEETARRGLHFRGHLADTIRGMLEGLLHLGGFARLTAFWQLLSILSAAKPRDIRPLTARPFSLSGTPAQQDAIRRAVSYIIAHHREPIRLSALLRLTAMSRPTFARQFRRHSGKTFSMFLNQVRLQAVRRALRDTAEPIGSIALGHGFNQLSFFNRLFRRCFGVNPSAFRTTGSISKTS